MRYAWLICLVLAGCFSAPALPRVPALDEEAFFVRHATGTGAIPAVAVGLSTLTWLIRGLFIAAAGCVICSFLAGSVPVLGAFGAGMFGRTAGACLACGVACLVLSVVIVRVVEWIDKHPVLSAAMFITPVLAFAALCVYVHRYTIENWTQIDWNGDGRIGRSIIPKRKGAVR